MNSLYNIIFGNMKKLVLLFALLAISANAINCLKVPENYMPDSVYNPFEKGVTIDYYTKGHFDSTVTRYTDTDSIEVERNFFENIQRLFRSHN